MEWWWGVLGAMVPALVARQVVRSRGASEEEQLRDREGKSNSTDSFVCERICTSKRMLNRVGAFSKDPTPNNCVTVCGVSEVDACADACARSVCANAHHVPNWNDICMRRCQSQCLKAVGSESSYNDS